MRMAAHDEPRRYDWSSRVRTTTLQALRYSRFVVLAKRVLSLGAFLIIAAVLAFFFVARAPRWAAQAVPLLMKRRMGSTPNPGSTLQSLRRGQLTEIDYLNGAVVAEAHAAGMAAPVNEAVTALVHEVERSSAFLDPDTVAARMRPLLAS